MTNSKILIEYYCQDTLLEGFFVPAEAPKGTVLIAHAWGGRDAFVEAKATELASLGYNAFALDVYGKGVRGHNPDENEKLMQPLLENRPLLQNRLIAALETLKSQAQVDPQKIAAIGYCFGGLCCLDLARTGTELAGVVSLHGLFSPPGNTDANTIKAKVLVLHGYEDPLATPDQMLKLAEELTRLQADWQIHAYSNTLHAFSNPAANAPEAGALYNATADKRSWRATLNFLEEVFA